MALGVGSATSTCAASSHGLSSGSSAFESRGERSQLRAKEPLRLFAEGVQEICLGVAEPSVEGHEQVDAVWGGNDAACPAIGRVGPALNQPGIFEIIEEVCHDRAVDAEVLS